MKINHNLVRKIITAVFLGYTATVIAKAWKDFFQSGKEGKRSFYSRIKF